MSDTRRIGEDLDRAMGHEIEQKRQGDTIRTQAAVEASVRVFRAAGLSPPFGWDQDDGERLWVSRLRQYLPEAILAAANAWQKDSNTFPLLNEFETVVEYQQHQLEKPARPVRQPGVPCPECGDTEDDSTDGWVWLSDPTQGGAGLRRPCSICTPERHAAWQRGWRKPKKVAS